MRRLISLLAVCAATATVGVGLVSAGAGPVPSDLQAIRAQLARYHSVAQAAADGYVAGSPCEAQPAGGMGIHYVNPSLLGAPLDPSRPAILLYQPDSAGALKLVGVEYFAVDADQNLATDADRPNLFGQAFDGPMTGHHPQMPVHYDLHVWLYEANPDGVFAQWNPAVTCP